jgi:beta-lactamase regulating signal transducer with metallopeptidase domain
MHVDWSAFRLPVAMQVREQIVAGAPTIEAKQGENEARLVDRPTDRANTEGSPPSVPERNIALADLAENLRIFWARGKPVLFWLWIGGAAMCALVAAARIVRFERLLRSTLPASERLQQRTAEIASKLGVRRVPDVRYAQCVEVPLLWCVGRRPTIVLPMRLLRQFDEQQAALILAHEVAHLRRRDHWVRGMELIVSTAYWWNPLVWVIRRQIHQAEDLCCDAWVRLTYPDCTRRYAEVVLKTAESISASQVGARLLPASPFLRSLSQKARIEMILESRFTPSVSMRSMVVIALFAFVVLPSFVLTTKAAAWGGPKEGAPRAAVEPDDPMKSEFPYALKFDQGATRFSDGDKITILEVRGTADTFARGNLYCVKGTYTLASRDRAILLASATVKDPDIGGLGLQDLRVRSDYFLPGLGRDPGNATGVELKVQRADVNRGTGTFTLFFAAPFGGLPHVSFCSVEKGGASFGGTYFGTGDSTLKQWWTTDPIPKTPDPPADTKYSHILKFAQGATRFLDGDKITIQEIHGTSDTFSPNNFYQIKGTYTLASHDRATLAAYTTAREAADGRSTSSKVQSTVVNRGDGTFTLILPMRCKGWPHVSFYPADGGDSFGGNYFGTGDSALKRWWGSNETD